MLLLFVGRRAGGFAGAQAGWQLEWQREEDLGALRVKVDQDGIKVTACGAEETTELHEAEGQVAGAARGR